MSLAPTSHQGGRPRAAALVAGTLGLLVWAPAWSQSAPPPATPPPAETPPPGPGGSNASEPEGRSLSDFMDTRLSFFCTHEDVLRDPDVLPSAPGFRCGRPNALGILFFENYDTRYTGFETLSFLSLYKRVQHGNWDFEGAFVIRFLEFAEDNIRLADGGSYIRAAYFFDPTRTSKNTLSLTTFPVSSDRMRLGYSWRITWGGSPEFFKANPDVPGSTGKNAEAVPGAKLQLDLESFYAYIGLKTTLLLDPELNERRSALALLGGWGWDLSPTLRIEANGGVFDRGKNETEDVLGEPVVLYGASAQVALHKDISIATSIDTRLYRNDPISIAQLFRRERYPEGAVAWLLSAEGTVLAQTLKDPENAGSTRTQVGTAFDLNARLKVDTWRLRLDFMTRDLAYILHTIPSLPTYWDFPDEYQTTRELFASVGADKFFRESEVTIGLTAGGQIPATLETPLPTDIPGNLTSSTTLVIRNESNRSVLPEGATVALIWALKATIRKDFGDAFAALAELYYQYDPNTVRYDRDNPEGAFNRAEFAEFNQLGFNLGVQARF